MGKEGNLRLWRGADAAHVQQDDGEQGSMALHGVLNFLSTETVCWVLVHGGIHSHHVVHAIVLKPVASKEKQGIHVFAKKRREVIHSLRTPEELQSKTHTVPGKNTWSISCFVRLTRDTTLKSAERRMPARSWVSASGVFSLSRPW